MPVLVAEQGRRQMLELAGLGQLTTTMTLSGDTFSVVSQIVSDLSRYGYVSDNQTALGKFLNTVKDFTGLEQKAFLKQLLTKYQMMKLIVPSPDNLTRKETQRQKILILAAIPHGLRLDKEIREIEEGIRRALRRDLFEISIRTGVRPQDIRRALAEERPKIVHFCGHGLEDGSLLLEDDGGQNKPVPAEGLAALFELHSDYVECVLLNACYSAKPAEAISEYIHYAIGMNQPIGDKAAISFAQGFYDGLGYATSVNQDVFQRAFEEGRVAIQLEHLSEGQIPVIKKKLRQP
ncbi:MAG: CHAT domain-containing protein [Tolypothrix sp. Co-bin9]|nr:CHAT domain-containing protein [Tolypothrix sp. Co-bin9]